MKTFLLIAAVLIIASCTDGPGDPALCGNGQIDVGEECDGNNLNGNNCFIFGMYGTLECNADCQYTGCVPIPE
jgi:hypothetical protein